MKSSLLFACLLTGLFSCNGDNLAIQNRRKSWNKANTLIKNGKLNEARQLLDSAISFDSRGVIVDSLFYLRGDLLEVASANKMIEHALQLEKTKEGWQRLSKNEYHPSYLSLESSIDFAKPVLLQIRPNIPAILARERIATQSNALAAQKLAAANAAAEIRSKKLIESENYLKRTQAEKKLRESFLDQGLDIGVRVSGKDKTCLTLNYELMNAVWSHQMNKNGNISDLFDLGFKEIILTNGYDYKVTWRPKK